MEAGRRGGRRSAANKQKATDIQANAQADAQANAQASAQAEPQADAQADAQANAQASAQGEPQAIVKQNSTPSPSPSPSPFPKSKTQTLGKEDGGSEQPPPLQSAPAKRSADPRTKHPAIQATKRVLGGRRYPPLEMYDRIIEVLGESPDGERLARCRKEWVERGHNRNSWKWLTEWYVEGIPPPYKARASPREETDWLTAAEEEKTLRGSTNPS